MAELHSRGLAFSAAISSSLAVSAIRSAATMLVRPWVALACPLMMVFMHGGGGGGHGGCDRDGGDTPGIHESIKRF
jgi:hypothetical protein